MVVKYYNSLPLEIRKSLLEFRDKANSFLKLNSQATLFHFIISYLIEFVSPQSSKFCTTHVLVS